MKRFNINKQLSSQQSLTSPNRPKLEPSNVHVDVDQNNITSNAPSNPPKSSSISTSSNQHDIGWDNNSNGNDSFSMYMHHKNRKLRLQFSSQQQNLQKHNTSTLFKGIVVWVNGFTNPTRLEIRNIMLKHHGALETYLTSSVTHIIATQLSTATRLTFQKQYTKNNKIHIVTPQWITQSLHQQRRLKEIDFPVPGMRDPMQKSLVSLMKTSKIKKKKSTDKRKQTPHQQKLQNNIDLHQKHTHNPTSPK